MMKIAALLTLCILTVSASLAQITAITQTGDQVVLYDDGTWKYQDEDVRADKEIPRNKKKFAKSKDASFLLKSSVLNVGFHIDPKVWSFKKATENPDAEYELQMKNDDLYAMVISERVEIPIEAFRTIAVENGRGAAPDLHIVKEEYRNVNGTEVLLLQMDGTMSGIPLTYYGYYFSNDQGSMQYITYTSQKLAKELQAEIEELLNGFVLIQD